MLEVADLHVRRGQTEVLKGLDLRVGRGEIVALIGANGAGKTTMLMALSGLLRPQRGSIRFHAGDAGGTHDLSAATPEMIVRLGIVHCPEGRQVFSSLTVRENLLIGAYLRTDATAVREDLARIMTLFPILAERGDLGAGHLSGGEQMMLAIGRALMARPRLLLLDEPSLGLAPQMADHIFDILLELNRDGTTLLLVEQNARAALDLAHRAYVLETGRIALSGSGAELAASEAVHRSYLGGVG